jgi:hypothetical protein
MTYSTHIENNPMTELSPSAQQVLDAYIDEDRAGRLAVAAALRAVAKVLSEKSCGDLSEYADGLRSAAYHVESIAAELEGGND